MTIVLLLTVAIFLSHESTPECPIKEHSHGVKL